MRTRPFRAWLVLALFLTLPGLALSQATRENLTLIVSGRPGLARVVQMNGRSFVEIQSLARIVNGSLRFNENQIILTLPASTTSAPLTQSEKPAFSKDFLRAGIEEMAAIREWRSVVASTVQHEYPVGEEGFSDYRAQAAKNLTLASVAASTDYDRGALKLLNYEFADMERLSNNILAIREARDYLSPDALNDDPLNRRIITCAYSLTSMVASQRLEDDGTCY
jgi:hypothetical protein